MARNNRFPLSVSTIAALAFLFTSATMLPVASAAKSAEPDIQRIRASAERGVIDKQIELGAAYFQGRGVGQNEKLAAYWYEKAAGAGDPVAQEQIGYFYQTGLGVPLDPAKAVHWFQLAAAGGLASAKVNLGVAYVWGLGVPKNTAMALQLFHEALDKKIGNAAFDLGDMYYFGHGVPIDKAAAEHWFEAGVKLHDVPSEYRLALMLSEDKDHANLHREVDLLRESANAGYVPAMYSLGLLLVNSPEFAGSIQEAIPLLDEASKAGTWRSSVVLGLLERDGKGMPADDRAALYHFQLAILQGGDVAERLVKKDVAILAVKVGEEQAASTQSEAGYWYQQHHLALQFIYKDGYNRRQFPAFALAVPEAGAHAGRLVPTPTAAEGQLSLGSSGGRASKEGESDQPLAKSFVEE